MTARAIISAALVAGIATAQTPMAVRFGGQSASTGNPLIPVTASLQGAWLFPGYVSGATVSDASGNGNHGAASNAPSWDGVALSLNGTSQFVAIPYAASLRCTTGFTLSVWVKDQSTGSGRVLGKPYNSPYAAPYWNYMLYGVANGANRDYYAWVSGSAQGPVTCPTNVWVHLALTCNGTNFLMYTNGIQARSYSDSHLPALTNNLSTYIGANGVQGSEYFKGLVKLAMVYSPAISSNSILQTYNAQR